MRERRIRANYHTHTVRCRHAEGSEREYIENAIKNGLKVLGFSDHGPCPFNNGFVSRIRMRPDELDDYVSTLEALKKEYRDDILIRIGLEEEYYPAHFDDLMDLLSGYPIEYLILGQHFLGNEKDEFFVSNWKGGTDEFVRYTEQVIEGMKTGAFLYLAHPDVINTDVESPVYEEYMTRILKTAAELDMPVELNHLGIWKGRNYPDERFWKLAGEYGNETVFGSDAHLPYKICDPEAVEKAFDIIEKNGLNYSPDLEYRFP